MGRATLYYYYQGVLHPSCKYIIHAIVIQLYTSLNTMLELLKTNHNCAMPVPGPVVRAREVHPHLRAQREVRQGGVRPQPGPDCDGGQLWREGQCYQTVSPEI